MQIIPNFEVIYYNCIVQDKEVADHDLAINNKDFFSHFHFLWQLL